MNIEEIKELLTQFDQSTLTEFDLREGAFGLYMNKNKVSQKTVALSHEQQATTIEPSQAETKAVSNQTEATQTTVEKTAKTEVMSDDTEDIVSPIVGIVYLKPAPDKENFKNVGDSVKKGEVVCIVEAMKLMNEITATVDGVITEVLVNNEDVVEFNQPLFRVSKGV